jgi:hypothetical protein
MAAMSVFAVIALSSMAQRYGRILDSGAGSGSADTRSAALRQVDRFIDVRKAMIRALEGREGTPAVPVMRAARDRALFEARLDIEDYREVRDGYRAWTSGGSVSDGPRAELVEAFESRREELAAVDLEAYEGWDS